TASASPGGTATGTAYGLIALEEPGIEQGIANGVSQVREAVRYQMKYGAERDLGTVEPGKKADLMAATGNPLQEIELLRAADFVMKAGVVYKSDGVPRI
ncbi:MAG: hypothetical protein KAJ67_02065, partial [Gemmatimonadetes bacterium]|nr:hypothetical protein [Gemmatimonadota bacterium]